MITLFNLVGRNDVFRVKLGVDLNFHMIGGNTPLMYAVQIKLLLNRGTNINLQNIWEETSLLTTTKLGDIEMVKLLLA